jgi:tetratricopeptide (TPR) repeat protein
MLIRRNAGRDTALARSDADSAVAIIDEGLTRNPSQVELLKARSIALGAAGRFGDAAATLAQVAEVDSSNIDSLFAVRITNYYQLVPDSARLLEWTRIITQRLPGLAPYWYSLSLLLASTGDTAAAVAAIQRFLQAQPNDARGHIVYASYLLGPSRTNNGLEDSALAHARTAAEADTTLRNSAAQVALSVGARYLQPPADFEKAAARLQLAADWSSGRIKVAASYYLGVAQIQMGFKADSVTNASRDCEAARQLPDLWNRAEANIIAGAAQNREQANTLLSQHIPAFRQRAEAFVRNFCR